MKNCLYFILFFIAILTTITVKAQYWAPTGAKWHYDVMPFICPSPCYISYMTIESIGDTVLKGKSCKVLKKSKVMQCWDEDTLSYVYSDSGQVFWYNKTIDQFTVLYNFNAKANETWNIYIDTCFLKVKVDSTINTIINNDTLKTLYISDSRNYFNGIVMEKIGHTTYMFPLTKEYVCYNWPCDGPQFRPLRCFQDSVFGLYQKFDSTTCDTIYLFPSTVEKKDINSKLSIYPNPAQDYIVIEFSKDIKINELIKTELFLLDVLGRVVKTSMITGNISKINCADLPKGVYFLKIFFKDTLITKKIIKI